MIALLTAALLSTVSAPDTVYGTYSLVVEGHSYSREIYRRTPDSLEICADFLLVEGRLAARWERGASGWSYDAVHVVGDTRLRYAAGAAGDTVRWELEDRRSWIERRLPWEDAADMSVFHSGVLATYGLIVRQWRRAGAPDAYHPDVLVADGGELGTWRIEASGEGVNLSSPDGIVSELVLGAAEMPLEVRIPEQNASARLTADDPEIAERLEDCLDMLDWVPPDPRP